MIVEQTLFLFTLRKSASKGVTKVAPLLALFLNSYKALFVQAAPGGSTS